MSKNSTKKVLLFLCSLLLIGGFLVFVLEKTQMTNMYNKPVANSGPTPEQTQQQEQYEDSQKKAYVENGQQNTRQADINKKVTLTTTQQADNIIVLVNLHDTSSTTCRLSITANSKNYSSQAEVIYQPNVSTCAGFSVPKSELGAGKWQITIDVDSPNGSASQSTSFEVN